MYCRSWPSAWASRHVRKNNKKDPAVTFFMFYPIIQLYIQDTGFTQVKMEYSLEQDSMTVDSQVSLVSKVWFLCETVRAPVQLLLPDQKEIPFYLNKSTKFSTKKWELSNVDSLNNVTEFSKSKRSPRRRKIKLASLLPAVRRTIGKEQ